MPVQRSRRSHPSRKNLLPLYSLCLLLILTLMGIRIAGRSSTWDWMFPSPATAGSGTTQGTPIAGSPAPRVATSATAVTAPVPSDLWNAVEDRQVGLFRDERPVIDALIAAAAKLEPAPHAEQPPVLMADVKQRPDEYRGQLIALDGVLRRLERCDEQLNASPRGVYFQGWLFTPESGLMPWRVITREAAASIPLGRPVEVLAKTEGYFFKLSGYQTPGGVNVAPVLIGRGWLAEAAPPTPATPAFARRKLGWVVLVTIVGSMLGLFLLTRLFWRDIRPVVRDDPPPDWSAIREVPPEEPMVPDPE